MAVSTNGITTLQSTDLDSSPSTVELSAWASAKRMLNWDSETGVMHPKLVFASSMCMAGTIAGFMIGGRIGSRVAGREHIENSQLTVYIHKAAAERVYHGRVIMGFVKNGSQMGWRGGAISGLYGLGLGLCSEARGIDSCNGADILGAGLFTGFFYKLFAGWRQKVVVSVFGVVLSLPAAIGYHFVSMYGTDEQRAQVDVFQGGMLMPQMELAWERWRQHEAGHKPKMPWEEGIEDNLVEENGAALVCEDNSNTNSSGGLTDIAARFTNVMQKTVVELSEEDSTVTNDDLNAENRTLMFGQDGKLQDFLDNKQHSE